MLSEFGFTEDKIRLIYKGIASDLFQIRFKFVSDLFQIRLTFALNSLQIYFTFVLNLVQICFKFVQKSISNFKLPHRRFPVIFA